MIQEKDFLYRVPVKTAPITTPGGQIRNPEILVDVEGGEFMHGNILDANSTNKLINQSVKDAVDNKLNESGYLTKDLLEAETTRATEQENSLKTLIDAETSARTKGDEDLSSKLSNYVLTTALNQQVDTLNTAISAKQDAGNYMTYLSTYMDEYYEMEKGLIYQYDNEFDHGDVKIGKVNITLNRNDDTTTIYGGSVSIQRGDETTVVNYDSVVGSIGSAQYFVLDKNGVLLKGGDDNHVLTSNASTIDITQYALKTELPTVPTKTGQLTNDSNFMAANVVQDTYFGLEKELKIYSEAANKITTVSHNGIRLETNSNDFVINENGFFVSRDSDDTHLCTFTPSGIRFEGKTASDIPTAGGGFIELSSLASAEDVSSLRVGLSKKQDKITVNTVDITDIETADVTKLRTIVTNLINALISSGLIDATDGVE